MAKNILKYVGSKHKIGKWIASKLPPMPIYVEPFCGSAAVYFHLHWQPKLAILNDLDGEVVNLFRVLRSDSREQLIQAIEGTPWAREEYMNVRDLADDSCQACKVSFSEVERARRFLVHAWQAFGSRMVNRNGWRNSGAKQSASVTSLWTDLPDRLAITAQLLRQAEIENAPAMEVIPRYATPDALIYADPPYPFISRAGHRPLYRHEMADEEHETLIRQLEAHPGPVALSTYQNELYDALLNDSWTAHSKPTTAEKGRQRIEVLYTRNIQTGLF